MENHTILFSVETADLVRENKTGTFFWHEYDPEDLSKGERFSINYPSVGAAKKVWPDSVEWEDIVHPKKVCKGEN